MTTRKSAILLLAVVSLFVTVIRHGASASFQSTPAATLKRTSQEQAKAEAGLPPLLDRELFFGNPEISAAQLSPDGRYIAFLKPWKETRNIWVKKADEPYTAARLITADSKRPIPGFFWSRDSRHILFVQDKEGDENYNVYAVDPGATPAQGKETRMVKILSRPRK